MNRMERRKKRREGLRIDFPRSVAVALYATHCVPYNGAATNVMGAKLLVIC